MTEERVLKAIEVLLNRDCLLEEKGDDAYMYQLFYQLFGMLPYVDYFFDNTDDEDEEFDLDDIEEDLVQDKFNYKSDPILQQNDYYVRKIIINF